MKLVEYVDHGGTQIRVLMLTQNDAYRLIQSLASQLEANSPNVGRWEPFIDVHQQGNALPFRVCFSIAVDHDPRRTK